MIGDGFVDITRGDECDGYNFVCTHCLSSISSVFPCETALDFIAQ